MCQEGCRAYLLREALNSNTLNMVFGICVPATVSGVDALPGPTLVSVWWLLRITVINLFPFILDERIHQDERSA